MGMVDVAMLVRQAVAGIVQHALDVLVELVRPSRLFCTDLRVTLDGWCEGRRSLHQGSDILALIYK